MKMMTDGNDVTRRSLTATPLDDEEFCLTCRKSFGEMRQPLTSRPAVAITTIGAVALLVGVGQIVKRTRRESIGFLPAPQAESRRRLWSHLAAVVATCWTIGETLLLPVFQVLLLLVVATFLAALEHGTPASWDLVNTSIDRAVDVVLAPIGLITLPPRPFF